MNQAATWNATEAIELTQGTIHYRDTGEGDVLLFVHGLIVDGTIWHDVVTQLAGTYRCIVPDLPLGAHPQAMNPDTDLSPSGIARLIGDFIEALELEQVTLIGNDTGSALCQVLAASRPDRLARLVLTPGGSYNEFPPPVFTGGNMLARVPGIIDATVQSFRSRILRRLGLRLFAKKTVDDALLERWTRPGLKDTDVRRDLRKFISTVSPRYTQKAAQQLRAFDCPTLIVAAPQDKVFKLGNALRLAAEIPNSCLELIEDSRCFVQIDQPDQLSAVIGSFMSDNPA